MTPTAVYNTNNQVTGTTVNSAVNGFSYDAAGNVTNDNVNQYLYDGEERVCAISSRLSGAATGYIYDANGTRVAKGSMSNWSCNLSSNGFTVTSSYVLGLGGEQVSELTVSAGASTWAHSNVSADGRLLATYNSTGTYFSLNDWLGTKRAEIGTAPYGCANYSFSLAYGDGLTTSGNCPTDATEQHFTGKERDTESGLDYFGARYYASNMGRFMSPDPAGVRAVKRANPQTWNWYAYTMNNPLRYTDSTGMYTCDDKLLRWNRMTGFCRA